MSIHALTPDQGKSGANRFLASAGILAVLLLFVWLVVAWIDPYGIVCARYGVCSSYSGKAFVRYDHRVKALLPESALAEARVIVVGSSRSALGFDPHSRYWPASPVYNLSLAAASCRDQALMVEYALASNQQNAGFLVEISPFGITEKVDRLGESERQLYLGQHDGSTGFRRWADRMAGVLELVFAGHAIVDSGRLVLAPDAWHARLGPNGFWQPNPAAAPSNEGVFRWWAGAGAALFSRDKLGRQRVASLPAYRDMLEALYASPSETVFYMPPFHAEFTEYLYQQQVWEQTQAWQKQFIQMNEDVAREFGRPAFPVWDFWVYSPMSIAAQGGQWFDNPIHFSREMGEMLLSCMYGQECPDDGQGRPIGARVALDNLADWQLSVQARRLEYGFND